MTICPWRSHLFGQSRQTSTWSCSSRVGNMLWPCTVTTTKAMRSRPILTNPRIKKELAKTNNVRLIYAYIPSTRASEANCWDVYSLLILLYVSQKQRVSSRNEEG